MRAIHHVSATKLSAGAPDRELDDSVVIEEPLEIRVDGETLAITMRTPGHDAELAAGLLLSEGIIESADQLGSIAHCGRTGDESYGNVIEVRSAPGRPLDVEASTAARRGTITTSACGVCGRRSIEDLLARASVLAPRAPEIQRAALIGLADRLREQQPTFDRTGGVHAAGLTALDGRYLFVREDVGRHNAVDKVVGRALLDRMLPASQHLLVVSGRVSFEIVQKAVAAGLPAVIGVSAPTSLAVACAERAGLVLVGFCRGGELTLYSGRISA